MPRASRYLREGYTFHLTHRCHNRRFLLKTGKDRSLYRKWLYTAAERYGVPVYGYCITGNHVHIIVHVDSKEAVGLMMHLVAGVYGQKMNKKKGDEGSVWEHPYQCTIIQDGQHLLNCIRYISLNMIRAGVVNHPEAWKWCSHDEYTEKRKRYRIINKDRLLRSLSIERFSDFQRIYDEGIARQLDQQTMAREAEWSEALAVGDRLFVEGVARSYEKRSNFIYADAGASGNADTWTVREPPQPYSADLGLSQTSKASTDPPD